MGLFWRGKKTSEFRSTKSSRRFIVFVSAMKDRDNLGFSTDSDILGNSIYAVGCIDMFVDCTNIPGSYNKWRWDLHPIWILPEPILVGVGIGRGHITPRPEHQNALDRLNRVLGTLHFTFDIGMLIIIMPYIWIYLSKKLL